MANSPRILVTGATGFVGGFVIRELLKVNAVPLALVRNPKRAGDLTQLGVELIKGDLATTDSLSLRLPKCDAVIHLAGLIKAKSITEYYNVNTDGTERLIRALPNRDKIRFILTSSISARGPNSGLDDAGLNTQPVSHYGKSKLAGEVIATKLIPAEHLVVFRPPVVYGPRDTATLPLMRFLKHGWYPRIGFGANKISFIYVEDLARLLVKAALTQSLPKNLIHHPDDGAGGYNVTDFIAAAATAFEHKISPLPVPGRFLKTVATISEWSGHFTANVPFLSRDKASEILAKYWFTSDTSCFVDFTVSDATRLQEGLRKTRLWYEHQGWL